MSSFHRKNQSQDKIIKIECFNCGKIAMVKKKGDTVLDDGFHVHNIERWVCLNCHEELFDDTAMREIGKQRSLKAKAA